MLINKCPNCNSKVHLYAEHTETEEIIVHCCKPDCGWVSNPIPRHLTGEIQSHKEMEEQWH